MTQHLRIASELLEAEISLIGAELQSLVYRPTGEQYLWHGDAQHWNKRSPLLFPQVGRCWQDTLRHDGHSYTMPKHGLMIEKNFVCTAHTAESITLEADTCGYETAFPHQLRIAVCYTICRDTLRCTYTITHLQPTEEGGAHLPAYYQVGGHPGFILPHFDASYPCAQGYIALYDGDKRPLTTADYQLSGEGGCMDVHTTYTQPQLVAMGTATLPIEKHTFDRDALVFQATEGLTATLYDAQQRARLHFGSDAPVLAFWSPMGGCAPFVCFEPWWGSPDAIGYEGEVAHKRLSQYLPPYGRNTHQWYVRILPTE